MSTYPFDDLQGAGTGSQDLTAGTQYTFNLTNNSGSSYFTMETPRNFDGVTPRNLSGSITSASSGVVFNQSDYIAGFALPTGNNSFVFTPSTNVTGSTLKLRGTGGIYVELSGSGGSVATEFIMLVKTDNAGTSASDQFTIPTIGGGYNYDVDWGDGNTSTGVTGTTTHTFPSVGNYVVKISGAFPTIYFNAGGDKLKLLEVQNWGDIAWSSFNSSFQDCRYLDATATDTPDLSSVTDMLEAFRGTSNLPTTATLLGDFSSYDFSNVQTLRLAFYGANFNSDLGGLTGANALTDMFQTFWTNIVFNQDISGWNVSGVNTMLSCFNGATSFNQNLANWQLDSVTDLRFVFANSGMSTANYTDSIVGWANYVFTSGVPINVNMGSQTGRTFDTSRSGGANFANAGAARTYLTTSTPTGAGWTISGDTVI
jgi:hypothetical protein